MSVTDIVSALEPVLKRLKTLNLADPAAAAALEAEFSLSGPFGIELRKRAEAALQAGAICSREGGPSRFSRVAKPEAAQGYSVDAVLLWGDGPWHRHTNGEVNCMLAWEGTPTFCGHGPGWAVFAPGSAHVPSVQGGKMLIFYLLPGGAMEWKKP